LGKAKDAVPLFRRALTRSPGPNEAEFFFFYGRALLQTEQYRDAATQFEHAMKLKPNLAAAGRDLQQIRNLCQPGRIEKAVWYIAILLLLFTMHECAHAYAAWKLGDDTAKNLGRISLNPLAHLDLFGSVILPAILVWRESPVVFGWAKPVPVNPAKFRDERAGQMIVSFAGPAVNVGTSMVCFLLLLILGLAARIWQPDLATWNFAAPFEPVSVIGSGDLRWLSYAVMFLKQMLFTGLVLGCFNLIPVPPLDGSWILSGLLPPRGRAVFEKIRPYGMILFLVLVITPALDVFLAVPVALAWGVLKAATAMMGLQ
jgi:Zn-dependent protease